MGLDELGEVRDCTRTIYGFLSQRCAEGCCFAFKIGFQSSDSRVQ